VAGDSYVQELRTTDGKILFQYFPPSPLTGIAFDGANLWAAELDRNGLSKF
jgi:hypothetical protein